MGFVDRGGGREAKGSSLRRSKKNPGAAATRHKDAHKNYATATVRTIPTPPLALQGVMSSWVRHWSEASPQEEAPAATTATTTTALAALANDIATAGAIPAHCFIDGAVALLSRKLEADQEGILRRAMEDGRLSSMVCWCTETERQTLLLETCKNHNQLALKDRTKASHGKAAAPVTAEAGKTKKGGAKKVHFAAEGETAAGDNAPAADSLGLVKTSAPTSAAVAASAEEDNGCIMYCVVGVHVNNIDRTNKKAQDQWLVDVSEKAKHPEVVGVLSGLNLSRDTGTHYAQESLLREMWRVAGEEKLPLVLHVYANDEATTTQTADRLTEILIELYAQCQAGEASNDAKPVAPVAVVLYNGLRLLAHSKALQQLVRAHQPTDQDEFTRAQPSMYVMATADGLTTSAEGSEEVCRLEPALVALLPSLHTTEDEASATSPVVALSQLLLSTGAPWSTPQNMEDPYVCTLPNEPGNFSYVAKAVYDAMASDPAKAPTARAKLDQDAMMRVALLNATRVFFADALHQQHTRAIKAAAKADARQAAEQQGAGEGAEDDGHSGEDEGRVPRVHVPAGVPLVDAPPAPVEVAEADSLQALLRQAAEERERLEREAQEEEAAALLRAGDDSGKKKKEKKKNVKKNNRSNFSTFRNKDFAPRAARKGTGPGASDDDDGNDGGRRAGESGSDQGSRSSSSDGEGARQAPSQKSNATARAAAASQHADPAHLKANEPASAKRGKAAARKKESSDDEADGSAAGDEPVSTMAPRKARKKKNKKFQKQMEQYQQGKAGDESSGDEEE